MTQLLPLIVLAASAAACSPAVVAGAATQTAAPLPVTALTVVDGGVDEPLKLVRLDGPTARFVAEWKQTMPTPGWTFDMDTLDIDGDRIVVELTANRPTVIVAQVEVPATAKIPLGALPRGRYFLEIAVRRGTSRPYRPAFAAVLDAH